MSKILTQKRLKELLHYDPETGIFRWRVKHTNRVKIGDIAGWENDEYIIMNIYSEPYKAHRLAWLYMEGYLPEHEVDHRDRIKDNNKWENLRHVSHQCNMRNKVVYKNNKSGVTGVSWHKAEKKWMSYITIMRKLIHLGYFVNLKEAAQARWEAEVKYGFPNCNSTSSAYLYLQE
jgi:hypothetical protein